MARTIDLFHMTGQTPYVVEQNILKLRDQLETAHRENEQLVAQIKALPRALTLPEIQAALSPSGTYPLPTAGFLNTNPPPTGGGSGGGTITPVPNHLDIAQAVHDALGINAGSTFAELFTYADTVAWNIQALGTDPPGLNVGILKQGGGDGTYTCQGQIYACFRICYDNGANIKILTGGFVAEWLQEANIPLTDYAAPLDPAAPC